MTDFSSKVELLINRIFGMQALLYPSQHGNNVILDGVYQRQTDSQRRRTWHVRFHDGRAKHI